MSKLQIKNERIYEVIRRPIVTEKSTLAMQEGQYTFEVLKDATKIEIKKAVELAFPGRKVVNISTIYMPSHEKRLGRKYGRTQSSKKAIVKLSGEPLEEIIGA